MPDNANSRDNLSDLVPKGLLRRIKTHFDEKIQEAVKSYRFNDADEDSLTGAMGQALSTPEMIVSVVNGSIYSFAVESHKILGKGPSTPEKRTGADGIFQISVMEGMKVVFEKGLPFQSKKKIVYRKAAVIDQADDMLRTSGSGIVLRYGPEGYDAEDVRHLLGKDDPDRVKTPPGFASLSTVLGDWFLDCEIGKMGLSFDKGVTDPNVAGKKGFWVIDAQIFKRNSVWNNTRS